MANLYLGKNYQGRFRSLLKAFYKETGVQILLNTSFNLRGEPIVNSPEDAISTFQRSGLDILVLEDDIISIFPRSLLRGSSLEK